MTKRRNYAPFFELPDRRQKEQKELGIVEELVDSITALGYQFTDLRVQYPDPPDCICRDASGNEVAFEVVELVSQDAVHRNEKGKDVHCWWQPEDLRAALRTLLFVKDAKIFYGGPFAETAVVIFTDEPVLTAAEVRQALNGVTFGPFRQITLAFLIFSYMPGKGYEVIQLQVVHNQQRFRGARVLRPCC